jgi:hypothetical protein
MTMKLQLTKISAALILCANYSCSTDLEPSSPRLPERIDNNYSTEIGTYSSGAKLVGERPVLILDDIPSDPGRAAIAGGCLQPLPPDFELGYAVCKEGNRVALLAQNLEQRCEVSGQEAVYPLTESLLNESCSEAKIIAYLFNPPLRILVTAP